MVRHVNTSSPVTPATLFNNPAYTLQHKIGEGGFGQVYKAIYKRTEQPVAIKFLTLEPTLTPTKRQQYIDRFERETRLVGRLHHPGIVKLLDKGTCGDDLLFAVFEYVDGQTLKDYLEQQGALSAITATDIMTQVLDALAHAHQQGIIHRDIKPANIMLSQSGTRLYTKLLDFGIGTLAQEAHQVDYKTITLTQETLATPAYSAPEQLRGEPASDKTDLYVWGLVFLECLTGKPAVTGSGIASVFHQQLNQAEIPLPAAIAGHPLAALLRRVLKKKLSERVTDSTELYQLLTAINVSNLVGQLNQANAETPSTTITNELDDDATVLAHHAVSFTRMSERRYVTVLAVVLSIDTTRGNNQDPEVIDAIHVDQKSHIQDIAARFGGFNAGNLADTLLFYFGYPASNDNDARLAARTALEVIRDINNRNPLLIQNSHVCLSVNLGLHHGQVTVFDDAIPEGNCINLAMSLARRARHNEILCSTSSQQQLLTWHEFQPATDACWSLVGERQAEAIGFLRTHRAKTPFVARQPLLQNLLNEISAPTPHLIHVQGEVGVGKSRLLMELIERSPRRFRIAQCLPEQKNSGLYPVLALIRQLFQLDSNSDIRQNNTSLLINAINTRQPGDETSIALVFAWLALPLPPGITPVKPGSDQTIRLFRCLSALLFDAGTENADILLIEDLHWADPITCQFIHYTQQLTEFSPTIITTSRHAFPESDSRALPVKTFQVEKLAVQDSMYFLEQVFSGRHLSPELEDTLLTRTDGIPLFIEALLDTLKSKGWLNETEHQVSLSPEARLNDIPDSLRGLLHQQLDNLRFAKEIAQIAAAIGREFEHELLQAASGKSSSQIQLDINELIEADLVVIQRRVGGNYYLFKHALVRDAAYDSMTRETRQHVHLTLVNQLLAQAQPDLAAIARHYGDAESFDQSVEYWQQAAQQAMDRGNSYQSLDMFNAALAILQQLPDDQARVSREINLRSLLTIALSGTYGYACQQVRDNQQLITKLAAKLDSPLDSFLFAWSCCITQLVQANYPIASPLADELIELAAQQTDDELCFPAALMRMGIDWQQGNFLAARQVSNTVLPRYDYDKHHHLTSTFTYDPAVAIIIVQAIVEWTLGDNDNAELLANKALVYSSKEPDPGDLAHTLCRYLHLSAFRKDISTALSTAKELLALAEKHNLMLWQSFGQIVQGWALCMNGDGDVSLLSMMEKTCDALLESGAVATMAFHISFIAEAALQLDEIELAATHIDKAITLAETHDEHLYLVESYRVKLVIRQRQNAPVSELIALRDHLITLMHQQQAYGFQPAVFDTLAALGISVELS